MKTFQSKVALITGGSSGIGQGLARALAAEGAKLAIAGTSQARLDAAVADLRGCGAEVIGVVLDVTDPAAWTRGVDQVEASLGPIDILALNAGAQSGRAPIEAGSIEEWRWVWDVNVNGVYLGLRALLPRMKARGAEGHVLITASIGALTPRPLAAAYAASKAGALAIAEAVRLELANTAIGISVLCPALVRTAFDETSRRHSPDATPETYAYMRAVIDSGMDPLKVGAFVLRAIREGRFYIFTHPGFKPIVSQHFEDILAGFQDSADPESATFGAQPA